jgi:anti-sigma regulatory factor (Ser/Thr protein kinase)
MNRGNGWSFAERDQQHTILVNDPVNASDMRAFVAEFLSEAAVPEGVIDEVLMAVGEVVANACRHGRRPAGDGRVELWCEAKDRSIWVTVSDDGPGFDVEHVLEEGVPDVLSQGGRGFFLMRQLMDRVNVESNDEGTTVTLEREVSR